MAGHPGSQPPGLGPADVAAVSTVAELARLLRILRRREARQRGGAELTYRELAAQAGWSHTVVADYLTGKTLPPTDRFDTLIQLLGAAPAEQGALATARDRVDETRRHRAATPAGSTLPVPRQLPADLPNFTGREAALTELDRTVNPLNRRTVTVVALTGAPGVGKTALAVHWAHRVEHRFPDGQLFADLRGFSADPPARPEQVLRGFLTALGVPADSVPPDLDTRAALYRSLLAGRRTLVLLDNAADPQQVRPLLPGAPGCLVLLTSRDAMTGLVVRDRAHRFRVDEPPPDEAVALLAEFVGQQPVAADPVATRRLARLCGWLPVALCAAGERVAARPDLSLSEHVAELAGDDRLDLLEVGGDRCASVRAVFGSSYRQLPDPAARLFRLLGLHPGHDIDRFAAGALADLTPGEAARLAETLLRANLVRAHRPGRYRLPELLRLYAAECCHRYDPPKQRRAAVARLTGYYRTCVATAMDTLADPCPRAGERSGRPAGRAPARVPVPGLSLPAQARAWLAAERPNLLALTDEGARSPLLPRLDRLAGVAPATG